MEEKQLPFHYADKQLMEELLKNVDSVIKDSDAAEEKEAVQRFLQKVSEAITFVAVGSSQVGKSSLLNALFQFTLFEKNNVVTTGGFYEYRCGAAEATLRPDSHTTRIFRTAEDLNGLQIVDMPGVGRLESKELQERVREYIQRSSVLLAVFDAQNVKDYAVWDILEGIEARKTIFALTKCDLTEPEVLAENEKRLEQYMAEAGIQAPIFRVSAKWEEEGQKDKSGMEELRRYIHVQVIGDNPILSNQQENLEKLGNMLKDLSVSFEKRKKQFMADAAILENINLALDTFITNNQSYVEDLKESLRREIEREVEAYKNEIITKLDPHKIKERFPNGNADFVDYLNLVNEGYRKRMTTNVNRMTQESVQKYLSGLELVFEDATGYLRKRESLLALEDKFYGSMAESKKYMVQKTASSMDSSKDFYHTLSEASEELFMKIWEARGKRDRIVKNVKTAGGLMGAAAGAGAGAAIASAVGTAITLAFEGTELAALATTVATAGTILWPVVVGLISAAVIASIAKKIASANTLPQLERKVAEAIEEFKEEVERTKTEMTYQILDTVERMFRQEMESADRSFADFRISVNIDSKNVPLLEEKMQIVNDYMQQIEKLKQRSLIEQ